MIVSDFIKLLLRINGWPIPQQFQERQKQSWPIAALTLVLNILPRRPAPPFAFFRLNELRLHIIINNTPHKDSHVVLPRILHDAIRSRQKPQIANIQTRFFQDFSLRASLKSLAEFEMSAREGQGSCAMAAFSHANDELAFGVEDEHAYADVGSHFVSLL